jgi:hypothetical protein
MSALAAIVIALVSPSASGAVCSNEALRTGQSASLPDCRAYELVTPANSDARHFEPYLSINNNQGSLFPTELASSGGDSFIFGTVDAPLAEPLGSNGTNDRYEAARTADGWKTERSLSPSGEQLGEAPVFPSGVSAGHEYTSFILGNAKPELEGALTVVGEVSGYLQGPDGSFELVGVGSLGVERESEARWISPNGSHVIFVTGGQRAFGGAKMQQLEHDAAATGTRAIYDRSALGGPTRVVSLLPGDVTPTGGQNDGRATYLGASEDGTAVAFKIGNGGGIYVRLDDAVTVAVPGAGTQTFAGLSSTGDRLTFVEGGDVFSYDTRTDGLQRASSVGDAEVVNVCADGSHIYFISHSQIGGEGTAGEPNLYAWDAATDETQFVATVSATDLGTEVDLNSWTPLVFKVEDPGDAGPGWDGSRTTPDGSVIVFESSAKLTGYENAGHRETTVTTRGITAWCVCRVIRPVARLSRLRASSLQAQGAKGK